MDILGSQGDFSVSAQRRADLWWVPVALAVLVAIAPVTPGLVERYSAGLYPRIQYALTGVSNLARFPLLDLFSGLLFAAFGLLAARDVTSRGWKRSAAPIARRAAAWGAAVYLAFALVWGLNYRRARLEDRLPFDPSAVTADAAARLARTTVDRLNALYAPAHAIGWPAADAIEPALATGFDRAMRQLGAQHETVVGRPKRTLFDWYFRRAGVSGMTDPWFLETLLARDLLPFERPFVIAHEWSHLAGLADEGEANVAGWLACLNGSDADRYSGWLFMYAEAVGAVDARERGAIAASLQAGPRADLRAIAARISRQVNPRVASAGWRVYDSYLKANRVEAGAASYDQVVRLALGLRAAQVF